MTGRQKEKEWGPQTGWAGAGQGHSESGSVFLSYTEMDSPADK